MNGTVTLDDDHLVIDFPYDADQVTEIKKIPGAKWDKADRVWRAPMSSVTLIREFAQNHGFEIDPEVCVFTAPEPYVASEGLRGDGEYVWLQFGYDPVKVRLVKQVSGVTWDAKSKAWRAPVASLAEAISWAERFNLSVPDDLRVQLAEIKERHDVMTAASRNTDAELSIPGLVRDPRPYQRAGVVYAAKSRRCFIADDMGLGKGVTLGTMILTTDGWRKAEEISTSSLVFGVDGKPHKVLGVYPQGVRPTFVVTFSDKSSIIVDDQHYWEVEMVPGRHLSNKPQVLTTQEIIAAGIKDGTGNRKWRIPLVDPVEFPSADLPIHPYSLGMLLGDGSLGKSSAMFTTRQEVRDQLPDPFTSQVDGRTFCLRGMSPAMRLLGLAGTKSATKFIPSKYLVASIEQRKMLLAGLLDTDGHINPSGTVQYVTVSPFLRDGVVELVQSLGGTATVTSKIPKYTYKGERLVGQRAYALTIRLSFNPFRAVDKAGHWKPLTKYPPTRIIESIEPGLPQETVCFTVDGPRSLYVAEHYIVTHNTGQAIMALEFANQDADSYPAVVVCPPKLVLNWAKEYEAWLPHRKIVTVVDRKSFPEDGTYDVVVVGWSNISNWAEHLKRHRAYVLDESHACKNPQAARTKAMVKITKSAPADAMILCLTGTPITNRPAEFAPQLQILGKLDKFGGMWGYYRRYCNAFRDKWGHWHLDGASNLNELNDRLRGEGLYIRRTKEQVLTELPPVIHNPIVVEGDGAAMREYRRAEANIVEYLVERAKQLAAELGVSPGSAAVRARMAAESNEHLVRVSVLRKLAAKAKMETVLEWVQEHVDAEKKVVVAAHHREIVDELANRFGGLKIQGGQNVADVERIKAKFQDQPCSEAPVIVLSIQAGKEGHTLTAAQDVVFIELPWTPADLDQTYSRCHRMGQTGSVTATYFLCQGTIDEEIFELIQSKRQVVAAAVEGGTASEVNVTKAVVGKFIDMAFGAD